MLWLVQHAGVAHFSWFICIDLPYEVLFFIRTSAAHDTLCTLQYLVPYTLCCTHPPARINHYVPHVCRTSLSFTVEHAAHLSVVTSLAAGAGYLLGTILLGWGVYLVGHRWGRRWWVVGDVAVAAVVATVIFVVGGDVFCRRRCLRRGCCWHPSLSWREANDVCVCVCSQEIGRESVRLCVRRKV